MVMHGWLYLQPLLPSHGVQVFAEQVKYYSESYFNVSMSAESVDLAYSAALADAVLLYAHAATRVLSEGGDLHDGEAVTVAVRNTSFEGTGNRVVTLDRHGDRISDWEVMNFVMGADGGMGSVPVGMYKGMEEQYRAYEQAVVWPSNTAAVPVDYLSGALWHAARIDWTLPFAAQLVRIAMLLEQAAISRLKRMLVLQRFTLQCFFLSRAPGTGVLLSLVP